MAEHIAYLTFRYCRLSAAVKPTVNCFVHHCDIPSVHPSASYAHPPALTAQQAGVFFFHHDDVAGLQPDSKSKGECESHPYWELHMRFSASCQLPRRFPGLQT